MQKHDALESIEAKPRRSLLVRLWHNKLLANSVRSSTGFSAKIFYPNVDLLSGPRDNNQRLPVSAGIGLGWSKLGGTDQKLVDDRLLPSEAPEEDVQCHTLRKDKFNQTSATLVGGRHSQDEEKRLAYFPFQLPIGHGRLFAATTTSSFLLRLY